MPPVPLTPNQFPRTIYGIHDLEGANFLQQSNVSGWLLHTVNVNSDAPTDYTQYVNQNMRVIVRLNNGYGSDGTIPLPAQYDAFAQQCANWVGASPGAQIWVIGNEMNLSGERPQGQPILPSQYAACFAKCRNAIHSKTGHTNDQVIPGAVAPYNTETTYPANPSGDWVQYFKDLIASLQTNLDGFSIHTYGRGMGPGSVTDPTTYAPQFPNNHQSFLAYRDFINAIPTSLRGLPVYITETQTLDNGVPTWTHQNTGWVKAAYTEINSWNANANNQPIQSLILFRWKPDGSPQWAIANFQEIQDDLRNAIAQHFQLVLPRAVGPVQTLQQAVLARAEAAKPWMPVNNTAALWKFAKAHGLQDQQTDELPFTYNGQNYLCQVFNLGIVYVQVGDWGNIKVIPK